MLGNGAIGIASVFEVVPNKSTWRNSSFFFQGNK
jgi:hypothetical protein